MDLRVKVHRVRCKSVAQVVQTGTEGEVQRRGKCCVSVMYMYLVGRSGRMVECRTVNQGDSGSIPPTAVSKLRQFR